MRTLHDLTEYEDSVEQDTLDVFQMRKYCISQS